MHCRILTHLFFHVLAVLSLHCCTGFSPVSGEWGYSSCMCGLLTAVAPPVGGHGLRHLSFSSGSVQAQWLGLET